MTSSATYGWGDVRKIDCPHASKGYPWGSQNSKASKDDCTSSCPLHLLITRGSDNGQPHDPGKPNYPEGNLALGSPWKHPTPCKCRAWGLYQQFMNQPASGVWIGKWKMELMACLFLNKKSPMNEYRKYLHKMKNQ